MRLVQNSVSAQQLRGVDSSGRTSIPKWTFLPRGGLFHIDLLQRVTLPGKKCPQVKTCRLLVAGADDYSQE